MAEHTPTPWHIGYGGQDGDNYAEINSNFAKYPICSLNPFGYLKENAEFIVEAVNSHDKLRTDRDALLKALNKIIEMNRQTAKDKYGDPDKAESWSCVTVARAAIEQAEKEGCPYRPEEATAANRRRPQGRENW